MARSRRRKNRKLQGTGNEPSKSSGDQNSIADDKACESAEPGELMVQSTKGSISVGPVDPDKEEVLRRRAAIGETTQLIHKGIFGISAILNRLQQESRTFESDPMIEVPRPFKMYVNMLTTLARVALRHTVEVICLSTDMKELEREYQSPTGIELQLDWSYNAVPR
jgi:hypothetical protein